MISARRPHGKPAAGDGLSSQPSITPWLWPLAILIILPEIEDTDDTGGNRVWSRRVKLFPPVSGITFIIVFAILTEDHKRFDQGLGFAMAEQRLPFGSAHLNATTETRRPIHDNHFARW